MTENGTKTSWKRTIFLIPAALILLALPLLIFRPVKQDEPVRKNQDRFTFMTNTPRTEHDRHDLSYWEKTGNPELFAKPDPKFGYPAFLAPEMKDLKPGRSDVETLPVQPGTFSPETVSLHRERTPQELLVQIRIPLDYGYRTERMKSLFVKSPVFLLKDGEILPVPDFKQPASKVRDLKSTFLFVKKTAKDVPPEITVERSCGDEQLDTAAMRALFFHAAVNEKVTGMIKVEWANEVQK